MNNSNHPHTWWKYVILVYLISWPTWILSGLFLSGAAFTPFLVLGAFGPFVAALIMLRKTTGREGRMQWLRTTFRMKIHWTWYLIGAIVLPFGIAIIHQGIYVAAGGDSLIKLNWTWFAYFAYLIPTALLSGGNEEPGWRAYLTPELLKRYPILVTHIIVGVAWATWHLPLYFIGEMTSDNQAIPLLYVYCIPLSMILSWLYYTAKRSIIPAMLFHAGSNVVFRYFSMETDIWPGIEDDFTLIKTIVYAGFAIILLWATKGTLGHKKKQ